MLQSLLLLSEDTSVIYWNLPFRTDGISIFSFSTHDPPKITIARILNVRESNFWVIAARFWFVKSFSFISNIRRAFVQRLIIILNFIANNSLFFRPRFPVGGANLSWGFCGEKKRKENGHEDSMLDASSISARLADKSLVSAYALALKSSLCMQPTHMLH